MRTRAEIFCKEYMDEIMAGGPVRLVIGVSGGADSICLLFLMKNIIPKDSIRVVHVNHMIRGPEADEDSLFVKSICEKEGIFFREIKKDIPSIAEETGCSEEEAGRKIRYESFEKEAEGWESEENLPEESVKIAVAHHIEDSAETFLFNLFRGTGIRGLSGISGKRDRIIRPLLNVTRYDIEEYLKSIGQSFRTDRTNLYTSIPRNRIRINILPEAAKICPTASEHIVSASAKLRDITEYLDNVVDEAVKNVVLCSDEDSVQIDKKAFNALPGVIASMLIVRILTSLTPGKKDIGEAHVGAVMELAKADAGKHLDLPYGIEADYSYDKIIISIKNGKKNEETLLNVKISRLKASELSPEELRDMKDPSNPLNRYTKYFDCDKISLIASKSGITDCPAYVIRSRKAGDYLVIKDKNGNPCTKTVSDYLTDLKLSFPEKEKIKVVAVGSEVLWIIGYRMGDSAKLTEETVNVIKFVLEADNG